MCCVFRPESSSLCFSLIHTANCPESVCLRDRINFKKVKVKVIGVHRPRGFQELEVPRLQDNRHMKVIRL